MGLDLNHSYFSYPRCLCLLPDQIICLMVLLLKHRKYSSAFQ
jgi:hypothetical protein